MNSPGIAAARQAKFAAEYDMDVLSVEVAMAVEAVVARFEDRTGLRGPTRIEVRVRHDSVTGKPRVSPVRGVVLRMPP